MIKVNKDCNREIEDQKQYIKKLKLKLTENVSIVIYRSLEEEISLSHRLTTRVYPHCCIDPRVGFRQANRVVVRSKASFIKELRSTTERAILKIRQGSQSYKLSLKTTTK